MGTGKQWNGGMAVNSAQGTNGEGEQWNGRQVVGNKWWHGVEEHRLQVSGGAGVEQ